MNNNDTQQQTTQKTYLIYGNDMNKDKNKKAL